jgi:hypothetical protein
MEFGGDYQLMGKTDMCRFESQMNVERIFCWLELRGAQCPEFEKTGRFR